MFDASKVAEEIFRTLRSFNYAVAIFDEEGNKVYEPSKARRFFTDKRNITVALHEDGENSKLVVHLGASVKVEDVQGMIDTLRLSATKFGLLYSVDRHMQDVTPKDFANGNIMEHRRLSGSTKSSYMKLEGARMIIRHDAAVDETKHGARSRNIHKVFVESREGERFLMPSTNLMAGRAMTRHISEGGTFSDEVGNKISEMALQQKQAKSCASYCRKNRAKLDEDVSEIVEACISHSRNIKEMMEALYRGYHKQVDKMKEEPENLLLETDDEILEEKVDVLTKKLQLEDESVIDRPTCRTVTKLVRESKILEGSKEMIHLPALDCDVELQAWEDFKADPPRIAFGAHGAPEITYGFKNLQFGLSEVAEAIETKTGRNDGFANMLAKVAQELVDGRSDILLKHIAHRAISAAMAAGGDDDVVSESVKKLNEWFDSFSEDKIFEDDWGSRFPRSLDAYQYDDAYDKALAGVEDEFSVDDFLVMNGDDFRYGDDTLKDVDAEELSTSLKRYLDKMVESEFSAASDDAPETYQVDALITKLMPSVVSRLEEEGYTITGNPTDEGDLEFSDHILDESTDLSPDAKTKIASDIRSGHTSGRSPVSWTLEIGDNFEGADPEDYIADMVEGGSLTGNNWSLTVMDAVNEETDETLNDDVLDDKEEILLGGEDDDLSREDVVMPTNPQMDFRREVTTPGEKEDGEDTIGYINRLRSLAGIKFAYAPRLPQP